MHICDAPACRHHWKRKTWCGQRWVLKISWGLRLCFWHGCLLLSKWTKLERRNQLQVGCLPPKAISLLSDLDGDVGRIEWTGFWALIVTLTPQRKSFATWYCPQVNKAGWDCWDLFFDFLLCGEKQPLHSRTFQWLCNYLWNTFCRVGLFPHLFLQIIYPVYWVLERQILSVEQPNIWVSYTKWPKGYQCN